MKPLNRDRMYDMVSGACVLASGGGGSYSMARKLICLGVTPEDAVTVRDVGELPGESWLTGVINLGSPGALFKTPNPTSGTHAFTILQDEALGLKTLCSRFAHFPDTGFSGVIPLEVGATNVATPLATVAQVARTRRPENPIYLIDADAAGGRALPVLDLTLFANGKAPIFPAVVAGEGDSTIPCGSDPGAVSFNWSVVKLPDGREDLLEDTAMGLLMTPTFGGELPSGCKPATVGIAGMAFYAMTAEYMRKHAPPSLNTMQLSLCIGDILRNQRLYERARAIADLITRETHQSRQASLMWYGPVVRVEQHSGGTDVGKVSIRHWRDNVELHIFYDNENICAYRSDRPYSPVDPPCIMAPDSICYITEGDAPRAIDNSDLYKLYHPTGKDRDEDLWIFVMGVQADPLVKQDQTILDNFQKEYEKISKVYSTYSGEYIPWEPGGCGIVDKDPGTHK